MLNPSHLARPDDDIEEIPVTLADLPKCMAMVRFQMEKDAGHPLPRDAVTYRMVRGRPVIVVTTSEVRDE